MSQLLHALKSADDRRKASRKIQKELETTVGPALSQDNRDTTLAVQEANAKECEIAPIHPETERLADVQTQHSGTTNTDQRRHQWLFILITFGLLAGAFVMWTRPQTQKLTPLPAQVSNSSKDVDNQPLSDTDSVPQLQLDKNFENLHPKHPPAGK